MVCDGVPSEMKVLESGSIDEYYQTLSTWLRVIEEKNAAIEAMGEQAAPKGQRKRR